MDEFKAFLRGAAEALRRRHVLLRTWVMENPSEATGLLEAAILATAVASVIASCGRG